MLPTEKLGLPFLGWLLDQNWLEPVFSNTAVSQYFTFLVICWLITPIGHIVWGFLSQGEWLPLWKGQWRSFFPGDLFLGMSVAGFMTYAASMPDQHGRWFQQGWWHLLVVAVATAVAVVITIKMDAPVMGLTTLLSPSKLYHNGVLYIGYGSLAVLCAVGGISGHLGESSVWWILVSLVPLAPWVGMVIIDGRKSPEEQQRIHVTAHPSSYWLFWLKYIEPKQKS